MLLLGVNLRVINCYLRPLLPYCVTMHLRFEHAKSTLMDILKYTFFMNRTKLLIRVVYVSCQQNLIRKLQV